MAGKLKDIFTKQVLASVTGKCRTQNVSGVLFFISFLSYFLFFIFFWNLFVRQSLFPFFSKFTGPLYLFPQTKDFCQEAINRVNDELGIALQVKGTRKLMSLATRKATCDILDEQKLLVAMIEAYPPPKGE